MQSKIYTFIIITFITWYVTKDDSIVITTWPNFSRIFTPKASSTYTIYHGHVAFLLCSARMVFFYNVVNCIFFKCMQIRCWWLISLIIQLYSYRFIIIHIIKNAIKLNVNFLYVYILVNLNKGNIYPYLNNGT